MSRYRLNARGFGRGNMLAGTALVLVILWAFVAWAEEAPAPTADQCSGCHAEESASYKATVHATEVKCSNCHGNVAQHLAQEKKKGTILNPRTLSIRKSSAICLDCHAGKGKDVSESFQATANLHDRLRCFECHKMHLTPADSSEDPGAFRENLAVDCAQCHRKNATELPNSPHAAMGCPDCHKLHETKTISRDIEGEIDKCLSCHPNQELEFKSAYAHPLRERQIKCGSCHSPHSGRYEGMLRDRDDKTCEECHADISIQGGRHPLSKNTEHSLRRVKCLDCHEAHGGNFDKVLKHDVNSLCSTCHK